MIRKDFELIANCFREFQSRNRDSYIHPNLVESLANVLDKTNPNFDKPRFIAACYARNTKDNAGRKITYESSKR